MAYLSLDYYFVFVDGSLAVIYGSKNRQQSHLQKGINVTVNISTFHQTSVLSIPLNNHFDAVFSCLSSLLKSVNLRPFNHVAFSTCYLHRVFPGVFLYV